MFVCVRYVCIQLMIQARVPKTGEECTGISDISSPWIVQYSYWALYEFVHCVPSVADTWQHCSISQRHRPDGALERANVLHICSVASLVAFFSDLGWRCCFEVLTNPTPFTSFDENFYWHLSGLVYLLLTLSDIGDTIKGDLFFVILFWIIDSQ